MKRLSNFRKTLLGITSLVLFFGLVSCKDEKTTDTKEAAEEQNEAKFEDRDDKEDDAQYLVEAAETDLEEIEIGKLAQQKSTNADIKAFGKMLVDDHTKSSNELKDLASRKNISLPLAVTEKGKENYEKLNEKTGTDFDKKFAEMMVDGHQKAIDKMEKASENATDPDIRSWASGKIPVLRTHLEHAKSLKEKVDNTK